MSDKALTTLDAAIANGNATAAMQLVRQLGVLRPASPGSTDPELLAGRQDIAIRRRKLRQQEQADEIAKLEDDLQNRRDEEVFTIEYCTDMIGFLREQRELALIREVRTQLRPRVRPRIRPKFRPQPWRPRQILYLPPMQPPL